jgi:hypothetical protein
MTTEPMLTKFSAYNNARYLDTALAVNPNAFSWGLCRAKLK